MTLLTIVSLNSVISLTIGFVIGALVFRNNKVAGEKVVQELKDKVKELENKIK